jgi:hypothetical protein
MNLKTTVAGALVTVRWNTSVSATAYTIVDGRGTARPLFRECESVDRLRYQQPSNGILVTVNRGSSAQPKTLLTTNHTLAGRSANRRMYHGNQYVPYAMSTRMCSFAAASRCCSPR